MGAEICPLRAPSDKWGPGFNEAAANGRGNRRQLAREGRIQGASMRPRRMAAEIRPRARQPPGGAAASMRPRRMAAEISPPS